MIHRPQLLKSENVQCTALGMQLLHFQCCCNRKSLLRMTFLLPENNGEQRMMRGTAVDTSLFLGRSRSNLLQRLHARFACWSPTDGGRHAGGHWRKRLLVVVTGSQNFFLLKRSTRWCRTMTILPYLDFWNLELGSPVKSSWEKPNAPLHYRKIGLCWQTKPMIYLTGRGIWWICTLTWPLSGSGFRRERRDRTEDLCAHETGKGVRVRDHAAVANLQG